MKDFFKQQRRMDMFYDMVTFLVIVFVVFVIICKIILIVVK
jgi:hypothetical protein